MKVSANPPRTYSNMQEPTASIPKSASYHAGFTAHAPRHRTPARLWRTNPAGLRLAVIAGVIGCLLFALMSDFGRRSAQTNPVWPALNRLTSKIGLGIDQVVLVGHHYTPERDVFDALALDRQRSFLSFDNRATLARLQKLPWVRSVSINRVLPGQLEVRIKERQAFALWQRGGEFLLIDADGRVLSPTQKHLAPNLPLISGRGAATEAAPLMRLIASSWFLSHRLVEAVRVSRRRWTLILTGNVRVLLPAEGAAFAIAAIRTHPRLAKLIAKPETVLDFRISGRVAVRNANGQAGAVLVTTPALPTQNGRAPGSG